MIAVLGWLLLLLGLAIFLYGACATAALIAFHVFAATWGDVRPRLLTAGPPAITCPILLFGIWLALPPHQVDWGFVGAAVLSAALYALGRRVVTVENQRIRQALGGD